MSEEWQEQTDENGQIYYVNVNTGETSWEKPSETEGEWTEMLDETTGSVYYCHSVTYETSWEKPAGFVSKQEQTNSVKAEINNKTDESRIASTWIKCKNEEGKDYFYNQVTGNCEWEKPENFDGDEDVSKVDIPPDLLEKMKHAISGKTKILDKETQQALDLAKKQHLEEQQKLNKLIEQGEELWVEVYHPESDSFYYYGTYTNEVSWEKPKTYVMAADDELMSAVIKIQCLYRSKVARRVVSRKRSIYQESKSSGGNNCKAVSIENESLIVPGCKVVEDSPSDPKVTINAAENDGKVGLAEVDHSKLIEKQQKDIESGGERWVEVFDPESEEYYYYGSYTHVVSWEKPEIYVMAADDEHMSAVIKIQCAYRSRLARKKVAALRDFYTRSLAHGTTHQGSINSIWVEAIDEGSGEYYYYNTETEEMVWEKPMDFVEGSSLDDIAADKLRHAMEGKLKRVDSDIMRRAQTAKAYIDSSYTPWVSAYDPNSDSFYYYNSETCETSWDQPENFVESADNEMMCSIIKIQCAFRSRMAKKTILVIEEKKRGEEKNVVGEKKVVVEKKKEHQLQKGMTLGNAKATAQEKALEEAKKKMEKIEEEERKMREELERIRKKKEEKKRLELEKKLKEEEEIRLKEEEEERERLRLEEEERKKLEEQEKLERLKIKRELREQQLCGKKKLLTELEEKKKKKEEELALEIKRSEDERERNRKERLRLKETKRQEEMKKWKTEIHKHQQTYQRGKNQYYEILETIEEMKESRRAANIEFMTQLEELKKTDASINFQDKSLWNCAVFPSISVEDMVEVVSDCLQKGKVPMSPSYDMKNFSENVFKLLDERDRMSSVKQELIDEISLLESRINDVSNNPASCLENKNEAIALLETQGCLKQCQKLYSKVVLVEKELGRSILYLIQRTHNYKAKQQGEVTRAQAQQQIVSMRDGSGDTLLHECSFKGDLEKVKYLVSLGADINIVDNTVNLITPLHESVQGGSVEVVRFLLKAGANFNVVDSSGDTPLHIACRIGNYAIVAELLKIDPSLVAYRTKNYKRKYPIDAVKKNSIRELMLEYDEMAQELSHCGNKRAKEGNGKKNNLSLLKRQLQGMKHMGMRLS